MENNPLLANNCPNSPDTRHALVPLDPDGDTFKVTVLHIARNKANFWHIGFIAFFAVASGPVGIEDAVKAAGPFYSLITLLVVGVFWSIPQAYMAVELSTTFDENGGYIIWVHKAFGNFGGWINAHANIFCNFFDLAMYPILFADYLHQLYPLSLPMRFVAVSSVSIFCLILNTRSFSVVGNSSAIFFIFVIAPYLVQPFVSISSFQPENLLLKVPFGSINWGLLLNTILWNMTGWDSIGCVAGEVQNPSQSYPLGILVAVLLVVFNYVFPIAISGMLNSDYDQWKEGYFVKVASDQALWLGRWMLIACGASIVGSLNVLLSASARALWRASKFGMVPRVLSKGLCSKNSAGNDSQIPVISLLIHTVVIIAISTFGSFASIVELDNFLTCFRLVMEFAAFVWMKWKLPDLHRPVPVPGGVFGAILITIPKAILVCLTMYFASWETWLGCCSVLAVSATLYPLWMHGYLAKLGFSVPLSEES